MSAGVLTGVRASVRWTPDVGRGIGALAILAGCEFAARATAGNFVIAGPSQIAQHLFENAGLVARALGVTLQAPDLAA